MKRDTTDDLIRGRVAIYVLGAASPEEAQWVEEHIAASCGNCQADLDAYEAVAEVLGSAVFPAEPSSGVRARLLADVANEHERPRVESLVVRTDDGHWEEQSEGVFVKQLCADAARGTVTSLYRLLPGAFCGGHRHTGVEECLVLEGDFCVNGDVLRAGDYRRALPGSVDEILWTESGTLLLIVAEGMTEPVA